MGDYMADGEVLFLVAAILLLVGCGIYVLTGFVARKVYLEREKHLNRIIKSGGEDID